MVLMKQGLKIRQIKQYLFIYMSWYLNICIYICDRSVSDSSWVVSLPFSIHFDFIITFFLSVWDRVRLSSSNCPRTLDCWWPRQRSSRSHWSSRRQLTRRQLPGGWILDSKSLRPQTSECLSLLLYLYMFATAIFLWYLLWCERMWGDSHCL